MQRHCSFLVLGLATLLVGCSSVGGDLSAEQSADPLKTVDLTFLNGHENARIPQATDEQYTVCNTADCKYVLFYVNIGWPLSDHVTRKAPAGEIYIYAKCSGAVVGGRRLRRIRFSFPAMGAHAYQVTAANNSDADHCEPTVEDKTTGAFVHVTYLPS
jgi:hypothetical protein